MPGSFRSVRTRSASPASLQRFFGAPGLLHVEPRGSGAGRSRAGVSLRLRSPESVRFHRPSSFDDSRKEDTRETRCLRPGSLSTVICPPCSSTILDTIASPSPTPSGLVVKNGLKIFSMLRVDAGAAIDDRDLRSVPLGPGASSP